MANYLSTLHDFEIVIVCDDSDSMRKTIHDTKRTRWDELCSIVKIIVEIGVIFDSNGIDLYFPNRPSFNKVKDPTAIEQAFIQLPSGNTPLTTVLSTVFQSKLAQRGRDKKLLVFVATDGDQNEQLIKLEKLLKEKRRVETTFVSFLLCNDDRSHVTYFDKWDRTMANVDVSENYRCEREKIRRSHEDTNHPFSYGDYVIKVLIGAIVPQIDLLNEPVV